VAGSNRSKETGFLSCAEEIAQRVGGWLMDQLGQVDIREKNPGDLVTCADLESQRLIRDGLLTQFPDHGFLGEESADGLDSWMNGYCWVVDPIDGTMNFAHQMPGFSVSIGLLRDGIPQVGVVYDPSLRETFSAIAGQGARMNGRLVQASGRTELRRSLLVSSFPSSVNANTPELIRFNRVVQKASMRRLGSAALNLCYVGCGRLDGYWASTLSLWDMAAGMLIAVEGGAFATHLDGSPVNYADPQFLAAGSEALHQELLPILQLD